jgi:ribosome biogenesis GTPase
VNRDDPRIGLVVARHRRHVTIEDAEGRRLCRPGGRALHPLIGDEVEWREEPDGSGVVTRLLPRRSALTRIDSRGRAELVAANLTQLIVVAATSPPPDWLIVDHYLVAAELAGLRGALVLNKIDLEPAEQQDSSCYAAAGYPCLGTSTTSRSGLERLETLLESERSAFVGQSGVGKSSLLNALLDTPVQQVGELTGKANLGRHTTSSAALYRLPGGGEIIDAPGVRSYAPFVEEASALSRGFPEFAPFLHRCRFDDCRHLAEPDCAVKHAVDTAQICRRRYASYQRLHALIVSLSKRAGRA